MTTTVAASSMTTLRTTSRSRLAIAWKTSRPSPGSENTFSITTVPVSRLRELQAHHRQHRHHGVAQHVAPQHAARRLALGARGAHEVLAQHVEHGRADDAREDRRLHDGERDRRQHAARAAPARRRRRRPRASPESRRPRTSAASPRTARSAGSRTRSSGMAMPIWLAAHHADVAAAAVARRGEQAEREARARWSAPSPSARAAP